jgi:hypothetical protein
MRGGEGQEEQAREATLLNDTAPHLRATARRVVSLCVGGDGGRDTRGQQMETETEMTPPAHTRPPLPHICSHAYMHLPSRLSSKMAFF